MCGVQCSTERLVCSVNVLYMELSCTGSLTSRASEHVIVQNACKTMAGYHCFHLIFEAYLTKLHSNKYILFTVCVVFAGKLVYSVNMLYMELSYTVMSVFSLLWVWSLLVHWFVL